MSASDISIWAIESALNIAERSVEYRRQNARGVDAWASVRQDERIVADARREFSKLSAAWPRAKTLMHEADRAYDLRVTSRGQVFDEDREPESCSCHINPPCGFCTSQADEEAR
jgi:hypothetical protein